MGDSKRPRAFGSTAVMKDEAPPSRRNTISMGSVRADLETPPTIPPPHDDTTLIRPPDEPTIARRAPVSVTEERTRVMPRPDSAPPPTIATPPLYEIDLSTSGATGIEMVVIEEAQLAGGARRPWRAAEVWTKRRVYALDSTYKCVEVVDRETGKPEGGHEMLGARLGGGRLREGETVRFSYPLPLPGMEAMFMKAKKHGYTSPVERMVVRVRVLVTGADEVQPSWEEIASRWSDPPPPK